MLAPGLGWTHSPEAPRPVDHRPLRNPYVPFVSVHETKRATHRLQIQYSAFADADARSTAAVTARAVGLPSLSAAIEVRMMLAAAVQVVGVH